MKTLILYASHKGNTRRVAEALAEALRATGTAELQPVETAPRTIPAEVDLLLVGGPTEGHGMTPEVRGFLDRLEASSVGGRGVAAFDTRVRWPKLLSGSAADDIAKRLAALGARVVGPPGSFIVSMAPSLEPGELERAARWVLHVAELAARVPAG